jgi:hypothetical protein
MTTIRIKTIQLNEHFGKVWHMGGPMSRRLIVTCNG